MSKPPKPRKPLPDQKKEALCIEAGVIAWNGEAERVEIYRDGDRLKVKEVKVENIQNA